MVQQVIMRSQLLFAQKVAQAKVEVQPENQIFKGVILRLPKVP